MAEFFWEEDEERCLSERPQMSLHMAESFWEEDEERCLSERPEMSLHRAESSSSVESCLSEMLQMSLAMAESLKEEKEESCLSERLQMSLLIAESEEEEGCLNESLQMSLLLAESFEEEEESCLSERLQMSLAMAESLKEEEEESCLNERLQMSLAMAESLKEEEEESCLSERLQMSLAMAETLKEEEEESCMRERLQMSLAMAESLKEEQESCMSERLQMSLLMADSFEEEESCLNESLQMTFPMVKSFEQEEGNCLSKRLQMPLVMAESFKEADEEEEEEEEGEGEVSRQVSSLDVSYQQEIRPLLDAIDKLRNLDIMKEGIRLPSIVVVGDQSSGKSSVLESLAGIKLPRGQGICTRAPLVMRLQSCADNSQAKISIEYNGKKKIIQEHRITSKIDSATDALAGKGKGISYTPITLNIKKVGAPDLTIVDLPGITRVPIAGQPADIYEQISKIIMQYITPKESIILNVLAANVDFPTCESIRMSQRVDEHGERTLAVVTKSDRAPEGLLEKVTVDAVNIGLGYVCVRNGINDETNAEAREKEKQLFDFHPLLKKIDKSMVGIPVLAKKLMQIQATTISRALPNIVSKINSMLVKRQAELTNLPLQLCDRREADVVFVKLLNQMKESLKKIVILGEFEQFAEDPNMHCTARLREMFDKFYRELCESGSVGGKFLSKEMQMLKEARGVGLPNFLPRSVFLSLLQRMVEEVSGRSLILASTIWDYLVNVIDSVIDSYCHCYPQLKSLVRRSMQSLILEKKNQCVKHVNEMIEMEKGIDFTLSPAYMELYGKFIQSKGQFMERLNTLVHQSKNGGYLSYSRNSSFDIDKKTVVVEGIGEVQVGEIMELPRERVGEAYEMQMSILAYWKVVILRMGDGIPMHLQFVCRKLVGSELEVQILRDVGVPNFGGMDKLLEESPGVAGKRRSLMSSLQLLRDSKTAVANIMDRIAAAA